MERKIQSVYNFLMYSLGTGTTIVSHKYIVYNTIGATFTWWILRVEIVNLAYKILLHLEEEKE